MAFPQVDAASSSSDIAERPNNLTLTPPTKRRNWWLVLLYGLCSAVGSIGGPFLQRVYYMHGGTLKWLQSCVQSIGFVMFVPPVVILYFKTKSLMDLRLFYWCAFIGTLLGLDNFLYSSGLSYLPVSTSSLLFSTQLAFTALFARLFVKQKFTFYSFNSVVVITFAAIVLTLHSSTDRPAGVTAQKYLLGFFLTLGGAAVLGLSSPLVELAYRQSSKQINFVIVLQMQVVMSLFSVLFCIVGMLVNKDFQAIPKEAKEFTLGEHKYYLVIIMSAILLQLTTISMLGMVSCTSSLFTGIFASSLVPVTQVAAVITFHEKFTAQKAMSLGLALWGFMSYFFGEYKKTADTKQIITAEEDGGVHREGRNGTESINHIEMNGNGDKGSKSVDV